MARVACYDVITDSGISLGVGVDVDADLAIGLVNNASVGSRSVLSFMLRPKNPLNLIFEISIRNGNNTTTKILTNEIDINFDDWRVVQEVVGGNVLTATGNTLRVKVLTGSGTLVISDIVLLYMIDI